jgi:hypothetical protein
VYRHVESVSLNKFVLSLDVGRTATLTATVLPNNATDKSVIWSSDDGSIASVDQSGKVTAVGLGSTSIRVSTVDGGKTAVCVVTISSDYNGHGYVDLGLSVKWATCNIGANTAKNYGDYFAWGETESKSSYTWLNYRFRTSGNSYSDVMFSKYNTSSSYGNVDNKTKLEEPDDVAHVKWGDSWEMPSLDMINELLDYCKIDWIKKNGDGKSMFYSR